jgi:hypothetical protein
MQLSRRQLLRRTAGVAGLAATLQGAGLYRMAGALASAPPRPAPSGHLFAPEQHLMDTQVFTDPNSFLANGSAGPVIGSIPLVVPPLHHQVITAKIRSPQSVQGLKGAQAALEQALQKIDAAYPPDANGFATPAALGCTVAWGLSYFKNYVPSALWQANLPIDNRATAAQNDGRNVYALIDAIQFVSDRPDASSITLEQNDVVVRMAADSLDHIANATSILNREVGDLFEVTSVRLGFVGGGFGGGKSLPKQMAMAAGIPGAESIPESAELFLGFNSTQQKALGPTYIANLEALPKLCNMQSGYFTRGTTMHLSHLYEDLGAWYSQSDFDTRVARSFRPGLDVPAGTKTISEDAQPPSGIPTNVESMSQVQADLSQYGAIGHSAAMQPVSRLQADVIDTYGNAYPAGTPIPQRADFNTLDNPFFYSAAPERDGYSDSPAAGLHFVVFAPTSDAFHRTRRSMDGTYPSGTTLSIGARDPHQGFNSILQTTHRQNFLVPPRAHRSFPLAELL